MNAQAIVLEQPLQLSVRELPLVAATANDLVVDISWSGISTGTEKLLWSGRMPTFPGMGYPLVPGYESVGRVAQAGASTNYKVGEMVFVPGAACFGDVRGLFGGAASRVVIPALRAMRIKEELGEQGTLLALAATAYHAHSSPMMARLAVIAGAKPVVWDTNPERRTGNVGYDVIDPKDDSRTNYRCICDVSGDAKLLDTLIAHSASNCEIVLAGFYDQPISFAFAPAFMREARIRVAAQWKPQDLQSVLTLVESGRLSLENLITHRSAPDQADAAYRTAFSDPNCLKMILDWRNTK
ncbi:MAG: chlorophyll synthesis pathway protein BchC [Oxalobacteraceae bacterium]|nr:chlorophyll synthesis pathway protein BchC [Oxalobacteraceae bacterium]